MWTGVVECVEFNFLGFPLEFARRALTPAMMGVSIPSPPWQASGFFFSGMVLRLRGLFLSPMVDQMEGNYCDERDPMQHTVMQTGSVRILHFMYSNRWGLMSPPNSINMLKPT
jgi:hypothetical protein